MADEVSKRDLNRITVLLGVGDDADLEIKQIRVDPTSLRLLVDAITELEGHGTVGDGTTTVATAGEEVQLSATSVSCKRVYVQSHADNGALTNGGLVVVGGSAVVAAANGRRGIALYPTQGVWLEVDNLNLVYLDSVDDGAKVHFYYED